MNNALAAMQGSVAQCLIFLIFVSFVESARVVSSQSINCLSCHEASPPGIGCTDRNTTTLDEIKTTGVGSPLYYRGQDIVTNCVQCAIQDVWNIKKRAVEGKRRKFCFVTNLTTGCTYDYPIGSSFVIETCRCETDNCNLGQITDIGGHFDINLFPKQEPFPNAESSATKSYMFGIIKYWRWATVLLIILNRLEHSFIY